MPYSELAEFMTELREQEGIAARALELAILTVARTGEVLGARWDDFNLAERLWTIPAARMSSFSDWCAEQTNFPSEVREMALAHVIGDKVELAYRRGDLFEKRREVMAAWARYAEGGAKVVELVRHAG